jgi:hypothetical protein
MVHYLAFADNVVIIGRTDKCLKESTQQLDEEAQQLGLEINNDKTKYIMNTRNKEMFGRTETGNGKWKKLCPTIQISRWSSDR